MSLRRECLSGRVDRLPNSHLYLLDCEGDEPLLARSPNVLRDTVVDPETDETTDCGAAAKRVSG